MNSNDIISKLNSLKEIEPNENWVASVRERILTNAPINDIAMNFHYQKPSNIDKITYALETITGKYKYIPSIASMAIILLVGSFITVTAAKTSLPGDPLYSVKLTNENIILAVTSDDEKPKVEMEIAGKRLEELAEISKKASDSDQQAKVEQLVNNFQEKIVSANDKMTKISQKSEKKKVAKVAKVINNQSEKYTELLSKTSEGLPNIVKEKVNEKIASALDITEKVNTDSLLILVESNEDIDDKEISNEEITSMILKKVETITDKEDADIASEGKNGNEEEKINNAKKNDEKNSNKENTEAAKEKTVIADSKTALLESINQNIKDNKLVDAVKDVVEMQNINEKKGKNLSESEVVADETNEAITPVEGGVKKDDSSSVGDKDVDNKVNLGINPVPVE